MSAYVLDRSNFVTLACFAAKHAGREGLWVHHPDTHALNGSYYLTPLQVGNVLMMGNLESVAGRYKEQLADMPPLREREVQPGKAPEAVELFGILRSLDYQSCEPADYETSHARATILALLWKAAAVAAEEAGVPDWAS